MYQIIILNVNRLNAPIKRECGRLDLKKITHKNPRTYDMLPTRDLF